MLAEAIIATDNYAAQIEVCGKWQTVIDKLTKAEAERYASRWERSRVVKLAEWLDAGKTAEAEGSCPTCADSECAIHPTSQWGKQ